MTRILLHSARRGFTITETMVSLSIMTFIFSFMAYLMFMTSRNAMNVHEQILSQTKASSAMERAANVLRNAAFFAPVGTDDASDTTNGLTRIRFAMPLTNTTYSWGVVAYDVENDKNKDLPDNRKIPGGVLKIYLDESKVSWGGGATDPGGTPDYQFDRIEDFLIVPSGACQLSLRFRYHYSGFALSNKDTDGDGIKDHMLTGQFITNVIAKNHDVGEGVVNYAERKVAAKLIK